MATSTIADISATKDAWTEVFTASGVASGSNLVIQNKGSCGIFIQTNTSNVAPALSDCSGWVLEPSKAVKITAENYIFVKASSSSAAIHVETA